MKDTLRLANKFLKVQNFSEQQIGEGPIILPEDFDHNQPLYGKDWKSTELKSGELIDMSRIRGPTNVAKLMSPFTGRKFELYKLAKDLTENNLVTLSGPWGIGIKKIIATIKIIIATILKNYCDLPKIYCDLPKNYCDYQKIF